MKFTAPFEVFDQAISIVNANPVTNILNDICQYVLIETNADKLGITLTKSDLDVHITASTKAKIDQSGRTLVHGETLAKILRTYKNLKKDDDCSVIIASDKNKVTISFSDNKNYKPTSLSTKDPEDFAPIDAFTNEIASCEITADLLKDYFTKNLIAINKHESDPKFAGVYFKYKNKNIELDSSNRLEVVLIRDTPLSTNYAAGLNQAFALIPRKTLDTAIKIIKGNKAIKVSSSPDMVKIEGEVEDVFFTILNNTYDIEAPIDGDAMVPKSSKITVAIPTAGLKAALSHMEAIMEKSLPHRISISVNPTTPDFVILSCKTPNGEIPGLPIDATVEKSPNKEPSIIILNDQKLSLILKATKSDKIKISYEKTGSTCVFTGEDENYFTLVASTLDQKAEELPKVKPASKNDNSIELSSFDDLSTIEDPNELEEALMDIDV